MMPLLTHHRRTSPFNERYLVYMNNGPESQSSREDVPVEQESQEAKEKQDLPKNPEDIPAYCEKMADEAQDALDARVIPQLEKAQAVIKSALTSMENLPANEQQQLRELMGNIETVLCCQNVGRALPHFDVTVEVGIGQTRNLDMADGSKMPVIHKHPYGSIRDTTDGDGEQTDVLIGNATSFTSVYRIDQGDENKYVLCVGSAQEALQCYMDDHPEKKPGEVTIAEEIPVEDFKERIGKK